MGDSDIKKEVEKQKEPQKTEKTAKKKAGFFRSLKAEYKKIVWPDRNEVLKQSVAVVCISIVLGAVIAVLDFLMQYGVDFLTSL